MTGLLMAYYNEVAEALMAGRWAPLFLFDDALDETLWESWADGFGVTLDLPQFEQKTPVVEQRVVARTPRQTARAVRLEKALICPEAQRARVTKA